MFSYSFQWNQALNRLPQMLEGALVTMEVAILSMLLGIALAIMLTGFRLSGNRVLMAFATTWVEIEGGNHAQFGDYGVQKKDLAATITAAEQWEQVIAATLELMEKTTP